MTRDLRARMQNHKTKVVKGFTSKYNADILVYYEATDDHGAVLFREKQIKAGSRKKKIELIESQNPEWRDLTDSLG